MAFDNYKTMLKGSAFISNGFSAFLGNWKKMNTIKKIKKNHDYAWYNEYLKVSKKIKTLFQQHADYDNVVTISAEDLPTTDSDVIELYLSEIYLSHDVRYTIVENVYTIQLTPEYMRS